MTLYKGQEEAFDSCLKQSNELDIKCTDMDEQYFCYISLKLSLLSRDLSTW